MRMFAVGNPSRRPSFSPATTRPRIEYARPNKSRAARKSPAASAARTPLELTRTSSTHTDGTSSSANRPASAAACSSATLPAPPRPKRKSWPTTTADAAKRSASRFTNCSPLSCRSFSSKRSTHRHVQIRTLEHAPALAQIREPRRRILRRAGAGIRAAAARTSASSRACRPAPRARRRARSARRARGGCHRSCRP